MYTMRSRGRRIPVVSAGLPVAAVAAATAAAVITIVLLKTTRRRERSSFNRTAAVEISYLITDDDVTLYVTIKTNRVRRPFRLQ